MNLDTPSSYWSFGGKLPVGSAKLVPNVLDRKKNNLWEDRSHFKNSRSKLSRALILTKYAFTLAFHLQNPTRSDETVALAQAFKAQVVYPVRDQDDSQAALEAAQKDYKKIFGKVDNRDIVLVIKSQDAKAIVSKGMDIVTLSNENDERELLRFTGYLIARVTSALSSEGPSLSDLKEIIRKGYSKYLFVITTVAAVLSGLGSFLNTWYGTAIALTWVIGTIIFTQTLNYIKERRA